MFGTRLGAVTDIKLTRDPRSGRDGQFAARVEYVIQPERALHERDQAALEGSAMRSLVEQDMRVVLKTSNLLTGEQVLSLEYVPDAGSARLQREGDTWILPSETESLHNLSHSLGQIAARINSIPFREIGQNLNRTLVSLERSVGGPELRDAIVSLKQTLDEVQLLAKQANQGLTPALKRLPNISAKLESAVESVDASFGENGYGSDSTVQRNLERLMDEVAKAARSIRLLADYLNRHPDHVIRGRASEAQ
jgi:paraquat-inducible protein B